MEKKKSESPADDPHREGKSRIPPPSRWSEVMDELFEEAVRSGAFDDLPGRGQPLKLTQNPYAPGTELAHQLLKDNNYTLPWIAERQAVLEMIGSLRLDIMHLWRRHQAEYRPARSDLVRKSLILSWDRQLDSWQFQIERINNKIANVNLKQPGEQLEILKLTLENELTRAGAQRALD